MNIWFTSDTHLDHFNCIKHSNRPFRTGKEMNDVLIDNWNKLIKPNDTVYFLGDFCWNNPKHFLGRINGQVTFIAGNHDKCLIKHLGKLPNLLEIKINKIPITLCHYSMRCWNRSHFGSYLLFGHSHNRMGPLYRSVDVGVDSTWITGKAEYRPFNFDEINKYLINLSYGF